MEEEDKAEDADEAVVDEEVLLQLVLINKGSSSSFSLYKSPKGIAMADDLCAAVTGPERARIVYRY